MGGLQRLFLRITPIVMILCFIAYGITQIFTQEGLTYINQEEVIVNATNNTRITITTFDFASYMKNINFNNLKKAVTNVLNIEEWQENLMYFKNTWEEGYKIGNIIKTVSWTVITTINILLEGINILIVPIRIIAGLFLTAFNIIGINTNTGTPICNLLNRLLNLYRVDDAGNILPFVPIINLSRATTLIKPVITVPIV